MNTIMHETNSDPPRSSSAGTRAAEESYCSVCEAAEVAKAVLDGASTQAGAGAAMAFSEHLIDRSID